MSSDPTMLFLASLKDPDRYVPRGSVCIFVPHRRPRKDGGEIVVTKDTLAEVAAATDRLRQEYGVVIPIGPGHRKSGNVPETEQPPIWGFQTNPRVGTTGPRNRPCVLVDEYVRKEYAAEAAEYPFRSPEYYPQAREIRWTALLKRDPALDMGMAVFYGTDEQLVCYQADPVMADEPPQGVEPMADSPKDQLPLVKPEEHAALKENYEALRMKVDQQAVSYARIEAENKTLGDTVKGLQEKLDKAECEKLVVQLEAEGYQLEDRKAEVDDLIELGTEPKRQKRCDWIRKHCRKGDPTTAPVPYSKDGTVPVVDKVPGAGGDAMPPDVAARVTQHVREHGCSWADAKKAVTGK